MKKIHVFYMFLFIFLVGVAFGYFSYDEAKDSNTEIPIVDTTGLPKSYRSEKYKFNINLPEAFTVEEDHLYSMTPEKSTSGVKFSIGMELATGTNLSTDTYLSVEKILNTGISCGPELFLFTSEPSGQIELNGHKYTIAHSVGAGAGNRYDESVFATQVGDDCLGIRYFIHYSVIENYPEGSRKEFNKQELDALFDRIRNTLITI